MTADLRQGHRTEYPQDFPVTLSRAGESFTVAVRQSVHAADLLTLERCTALCLLAREDGECICRCGGEFHGALIDAEVTLDPAEWLAKAALASPKLRDGPAAYPVTRHQLRSLPFGGPASALRLQVAMLAWNCGVGEAAKQLGMTRSTFYDALSKGARRGTGDAPDA